ncbi:MAG: MFS transporter [Pseudomonadota bacterium]
MQKSHRTRIIVALGTAQTLAFGTTLYLPAILAEPMARDIGVPTSWAFGAFSLALLISAFLGPLFGARIDRFGGRNILSASSLVFAAGLGILGLSDSMAVMCLAWLVIGIGMSMGLYESAFATLVGLFGGNARGPITGITLIAGFASTICWPISAGIEVEYGWRLVCFFWAGTHIVLGLPLNRLLIPAGNLLSDPAQNTETDTPPARLSRRDYFSLPMILLAFVFAASWFTATAMAAHLPRLLQISGMDASSAILAASLVGPAQVAGRVLEFGLLRHWHPMLSARLATLMHPVGAALLMVFGGPAGMIFTSLHGTGNGILTIAKGTLPLAVFGPNGYGARQGVLVAPSRFAQAGAPFLFGMLIDATGTQALWLTILLGGLAGLTLWFIRPKA